MIDLCDKLVLGKILPEWNVREKMVTVDEVVGTNHGECITSVTCGDASHKETSQENDWKETMRKHSETCSHLVVSLEILHVDDRFLWSTKEVHCLPETHSIQEVCIASMHTESVRADTRGLVNFCSLFLVNEATLDHPPSDHTLQSTEGKHAE